jgi:hypothetical protein
MTARDLEEFVKEREGMLSCEIAVEDCILLQLVITNCNLV